MIELVSQAEIIALKLLWENEKKQQAQRYTPSYDFTDSRKMELERIAEDYKQSEEKRQAKRTRRHAVRAAGKKAEAAENERWDRIFKEKFEDKSYYAR